MQFIHFNILDSILSEIGHEAYPLMKESFLDGYREEFNVSDEMLSYMPVFRRFANLYGYCRILLSSAEVWDNEPEWLNDLRGKLTNAMNNRSILFGNSI